MKRKYHVLLFFAFALPLLQLQAQTNSGKADSVKTAATASEDEGLSKGDEQSATTKKINTDQVNCVSLIKDADELYHAGEYDRCLLLLQNGMNDCHLSKREREDAWIIRARVNLEKDNIPEVNHSLIKLMKTNPNFKPKEGAYQEDFYTHLNKVVVRPMFSAGVFIGLNAPFYHTLKTYSVFDGVDYSAPYRASVGAQEGFYLEYEFIKNISLVSGLSYSSISYKRHLENAPIYSLDYHEALSYLNVPVYLKYYFTKNRFKPFALLGASYNKLQSAIADLNTQYTSQDYLTGITNQFSTGSSGIDQKPYRVSTYTSILFGGGCSYRVKNFVFAAEAVYALGNNNVMNPDENTRNENLIYKFYYVDNAVSISSLIAKVSVGYVFHYSVKIKK